MFVVALVLILAKYAVVVYFFLEFLSLALVIWLVRENLSPDYKIAWIMLMLLLPVFGSAMYLIFGMKTSGKKVMKKYSGMLSSHNCREDLRDVWKRLKEKNKLSARLAKQVSRVTGSPVYENTKATYFPLGEYDFAALKEELQKARKFIFMEYFIVQKGKMWDSILTILLDKVKQGVEVRFIYDDAGCAFTLPIGYDKKLRKLGIRAVIFNPLKPQMNTYFNNRDHRKICIVDGKIGFMGGINLADEYINVFQKHGHWKDTAIMLKGEAVESLTTMFLQTWDAATGTLSDHTVFLDETVKDVSDGYIQPFSDHPFDNNNIAEDVYFQIINNAADYVYITTPYLIIDDRLITALSVAAQSGVDVRIVTPGVGDKWFVHYVTQSYYERLIRAGVRIFEYTPGFIHAKMFVSDDNISVVGTINMDFRSFYMHLECGTIFYGGSMIESVKKDISETLQKCHEITLEECLKTTKLKSLVQSILRVFAPLM